MSFFDDLLSGIGGGTQSQLPVPIPSSLPGPIGSILRGAGSVLSTAAQIGDVIEGGRELYDYLRGSNGPRRAADLISPSSTRLMPDRLEEMGALGAVPQDWSQFSIPGRARRRAPAVCSADPVVQQVRAARDAGQITRTVARRALRELGCATTKRRCKPRRPKCSPMPRRRSRCGKCTGRCSCGASRRSGRLTAAQLRAGFGGRQRMKRR